MYCFYLRLGRLLVVQYSGFGSKTSRNQVIMQCYWLYSWRLRSPNIWDSYRSTCFDESFSWSIADWSCSTLLGLCCCWFPLVCSCIEESNSIMQCLPGMIGWLKMSFEVLEWFLNLFPYAGALGLFPASR